MPRLQGKPNVNTPEYWDAIYADEIETGQSRFHAERFSAVVECVPGSGGGLLDYAGGWGELADYIHQRRPAWKICVYERSQVARQHGRQKFPGLTFLEELPAQDTYDFVYCGQTLEHVDAPETLLSWLWNRVAPGGTLLVSVPFWKSIEDPEHVWEFEAGDLMRMLPSAKGREFLRLPFLFGLWNRR